MTFKRALPYLLLTVFLSCLVIQYPGDHSRTSQPGDNHQAVLNANMALDASLLKDDLKKHPLLLPNDLFTLVSAALIIIFICQLAYITVRNEKFYHPIFYQSNYLGSTS
ncbi:hypothetical protein HRF87_05245 [Bacillus sp. CRN 9]|nr:hypothetical protein [Bacillus sp. CRN 9]